MPLYQLLRKSESFTWTSEADDALAALKKVLQELPLLVAPQPMEPMLMYIVASNRVVDIVMVAERLEEGKERPHAATYVLPQ